MTNPWDRFQVGDRVIVAPGATYGSVSSPAAHRDGGTGKIIADWEDGDFTIVFGPDDCCVAHYKFLTPVAESQTATTRLVGNAHCPICGSHGFDLVFTFKCSNKDCQNRE